jgi:hypothetical protein
MSGDRTRTRPPAIAPDHWGSETSRPRIEDDLNTSHNGFDISEGVYFEFSPQPADVNIDPAFATPRRIPPNLYQENRSSHNHPGVLYQ